MAQPRKPKGSPNGTGGQFDHMNHTDMGLPALDVSTQPVGGQFIDKTAEIAEKLFDRKQDWDDLPLAGVTGSTISAITSPRTIGGTCGTSTRWRKKHGCSPTTASTPRTRSPT